MKKAVHLTFFLSVICISALAQFNPPTRCDNLDFNRGDFTNWVGRQTVYPANWPDANNCSGTGILVADKNSNAVVPPYRCKRRPTTIGYDVFSCNGCFSFPDWNYPVPPTSGNVGPVNSYTRNVIEDGRLTIMKNQGEYDPFTCGNVTTIPPGDKYAVRIGNGGINPAWTLPAGCPNPGPASPNTPCAYAPGAPGWTDGVGFQIDYLSYKFTVDQSNTLLTYKYAVVFQEPKDANAGKHTENIRPRFVTTLKDKDGNVVGGQCGLVNNIYEEGIPGYRECQPEDYKRLPGGKVYGRDERIVYRSWTAVGIDLRDYIGKELTLEFNTWDCGWGGHFGYAYVNARCDSFALLAKSCNGDVTISAPPGFSYRWLPNKETTKDIILKDAAPGATVSVDLMSVTGCVTTLTTSVYPTVVTASFTASENNVCLNKKVTFIDLSKSFNTKDNSNIPIAKVQWLFGDGSDTITRLTAAHSYTASGSYVAKVMVTSILGCYAEYTQTITVTPGPTAIFEWEDACVNKFILFKNKSIVDAPQTITSYTWSYNGTTVNTKDAVATKYDAGGTYSVNLGVTSTNGCSHDTIMPIRVWKLPKASFRADTVCIGNTTSFKDISIVFDPDATIPSWGWDFGDGTPDNSLQNSSHQYTKPGTYSVTLTIDTKTGCRDSVIVEVKVNEKPNPDFSTAPACLGAPTVFTDLTPKTDAVTSWKWDFNDKGAVSDVQNPSHTYTSLVAYNPTLTVATKDGCQSSVTHPITIGSMPIADFDSDKYKGCAPLGIQFFDLSFGSSFADSIVKWDWSFGDGGTGSLKRPAHIYQQPGVYSVSLTVTTVGGCMSSHNWPAMIEAFAYPIANFEPSPAETTDDLPEIRFTNLSTNNATDSWYLGIEGVTSIERNPTYSYTEPGTYDITLSVKNKEGCLDKITKQVVVKPTWSFFIPDAFSPDITGGINDDFNGVAVNITDYQMWIFDRWGEKVYYTDDITKPWNGYKDNLIKSGDPKVIKQEVYVWKVKFKDSKGKLHQRVGHVTALR